MGQSWLKDLIAEPAFSSLLFLSRVQVKYALEGDTFAPKSFDLVPLWESDSSITDFYKKEDSICFVHYYINDINVIGENVSDLVEFLVSEYVDYDHESEVRLLLSS